MKIAPTILLLLYVSAVCRPVLPLAADGLAHIFWHHHHLETVHAEKGHGHLHAEIVSASDLENQAASSVPTNQKTAAKSSDFLFVHLGAVISAFYLSEKNCLLAPGKFYQHHNSRTCTEVATPPPDRLA